MTELLKDILENAKNNIALDKEKTTVLIDKSLINKIDKARLGTGLSRSGIVRSIIEKSLEDV